MAICLIKTAIRKNNLDLIFNCICTMGTFLRMHATHTLLNYEVKENAMKSVRLVSAFYDVISFMNNLHTMRSR